MKTNGKVVRKWYIKNSPNLSGGSRASATADKARGCRQLERERPPAPFLSLDKTKRERSNYRDVIILWRSCVGMEEHPVLWDRPLRSLMREEELHIMSLLPA